MRKHAAPAPALFERPETALLAAAAVAGVGVGALPAPAPVAAALGLALATVLGGLALVPAPGERDRRPRHSTRQRYITAAVYIRTVIHLLGTILLGVPKPARRPLESEGATGSHPLESEGDAGQGRTRCWCGCGGWVVLAREAGADADPAVGRATSLVLTGNSDR